MNLDGDGKNKSKDMSIKALITDLDGTLITNDHRIVPGCDNALVEIQKLGLKIIIFSNAAHSTIDETVKLLTVDPDMILTKDDVGIAKGSPRWIEKVCDHFKIMRNEVVYLGDSNRDMTTAVNSKIVYLNAEWSNPDYKYGIPVRSPQMIHPLLSNFFIKKELWYWSVDDSDDEGNMVAAKALINRRDIGVNGFKRNLLAWAKYDTDHDIDSFKMSEFIIYHLLGSLYLDGIYTDIDTVTIAPGHAGGHNTLMDKSLQRLARLFRNRFAPDLLHRHTPSQKSAFARSAGNSPTFQDQIQTVCLKCDEGDVKRIVENKTVLVVDDFITQGFTTEWSRHLLLNAGAKKVISVAIGAFRDAMEIQSIANRREWESFNPVSIDEKDISARKIFATQNDRAVDIITASYMSLIS